MTLRFAGFARHLSIFFMPNRTVNQECPQRVIFNISVCSRRQQNVRYGPKSDQIDASQRTAASCQKRHYAVQQISPYSMTSSARPVLVSLPPSGPHASQLRCVSALKAYSL
jgi:hypothetical protein